LRFAPGVRSLTGADSSEGMLGVFRDKATRLGLANVRTLRVETEAAALPDGPYDLIVSSMTLHHVRDTAALLRVFHRSLRPAGRLCLADLDPEGGAFHGADAEGVFHNGFDRAGLRQALEAAGFSGIADTTAAEVVKSVRDGGTRRFTVFLVSAHRQPDLR
jgi:ubiquinone/menaquinone biosynthesis C-methylase UbiE